MRREGSPHRIMSQRRHKRHRTARCQGRWASWEGTGDPPPKNEAWRRKRRMLLPPKLSEETVRRVTSKTAFPSNFLLPWIFTTQKQKHKIQAGLGLLSFGRKHFQLSLTPKYFAPQSPWGYQDQYPNQMQPILQH